MYLRHQALRTALRLSAATLIVATLLPAPVAAAVANPGTTTPSSTQPTVAAPGPNLIQNPSFETPALPLEQDDKDYTASDAFVPGWTLQGTAALVKCTPTIEGSCPATGVPWPAQDGLQSVDVAKSQKTATLTQSIPTPIGHTFTLSFWYIPGPRAIDTKSDAKINVSWAGSKLPLALEDRPAGDNTWKLATFQLPAAITETTELSFKGLAGKNFGFAIDNVVVADDSPVTPPPTEVAAPELYRASPPSSSSGSVDKGTYAISYDTSKMTVLGLADYDPGTYAMSFYAGTSCAAIDPATQSPIASLDDDDHGVRDDARVRYGPARPRWTVRRSHAVRRREGHRTGERAGRGGQGLAALHVRRLQPQNDTWVRAITVPVAGTVSLGNWVDEPGIGRWFKVDVAPGGSVTIDLKTLPADYDVYLFKDIARTYVKLNTEDDLVKLNAEFAGSGFSGSGFSGSGFSGSGFSGSGFSGSGFSADTYSGSGFSGSGFSGSGFSGSGFSGSGFSGSGFSGSGFSGSGFSGSGFSGSGFSGSGFSGSGFSGSGFSAEDYSAAQYYSLIDWSTNVGTADEQVGANAWTSTGDFYIRVNGKNGAAEPREPVQAPAHRQQRRLQWRHRDRVRPQPGHERCIDADPD